MINAEEIQNVLILVLLLVAISVMGLVFYMLSRVI